MASKTKEKEKTVTQAENEQKNEKASPRRSLTAMEKCKAVLSIWAERRKPSDVCRALSVNWAVLSHWQNRAMEGMLQALEPRVLLEQGPALSPRLQALLEKRTNPVSPTQAENKLEERLSRIQQNRESKKEPNPKQKKT